MIMDDNVFPARKMWVPLYRTLDGLVPWENPTMDVPWATPIFQDTSLELEFAIHN